MKTLLTFTGFHDPYTRGLIGEQEQTGPILSLVEARRFDRIVLFATPRTALQTAATKAALAALQPQLAIDVREMPLDDPTDYPAILRGLRAHLREILEGTARDGTAGAARSSTAQYFIAVASGTPQMHACWLLLAASGEIPAQILSIRPPQFVTAERPLVGEVNLTAPEMPEVRAGTAAIRSDAWDEAECEEDPTVVVRRLGLVGDHPRMRVALETAIALAPSRTPLLILGETGTGKELIARLVHALGGRCTRPFIAVNCAAIPAELVESTLFGHVKGAFTGALRDQAGKFALADGGTLFLDEIGELPLSAQAKLLRVLQDGLIEPVGAEQGKAVDVRVVAATNRDLACEIEARRFREDLYYRIAVGIVRLPPLRERASDIPKLALQLLDRVNATLRRPKRLSTDALRRLQTYAWPGNVRDLENVLERSARLCPREVLEAEDIVITEPVTGRDEYSGLPAPHEGFSIETFLGGARRQLFLRALEAAGGNQAAAARLLGVSAQAVHKFVKNPG